MKACESGVPYIQDRRCRGRESGLDQRLGEGESHLAILRLRPRSCAVTPDGNEEKWRPGVEVVEVRGLAPIPPLGLVGPR